jgi:hypothetical protein
MQGNHPRPASDIRPDSAQISIHDLACHGTALRTGLQPTSARARDNPAFLAGSTLPHLAACANLRELTITGKGKTIRNTLPIDLPPNSFPVLDTVCIEESETTARLSKAVFQRSSARGPSCGISLMAFCAVLGMCPHLTELLYPVQYSSDALLYLRDHPLHTTVKVISRS